MGTIPDPQRKAPFPPETFMLDAPCIDRLCHSSAEKQGLQAEVITGTAQAVEGRGLSHTLQGERLGHELLASSVYSVKPS